MTSKIANIDCRTAIHTRRRSMRRGFSALETLFSLVIFAAIMSMICWATIDTARMGGADYSSVQVETSTRHELDQFIADAHSSSNVVATYTNAGTTYTSNISNTIILKAPSYDSSGNIIAATYDYIVYHLVGNAAPYTLNRLVVTTSGSRPSSADTVVATNVQSATFVCLVDQTMNGDGSTTQFGLNSAVFGTGSNLIESVTMTASGVALGAGASQVQFDAPVSPAYPQGSLLFGTAPASGAVIDSLYSVDPSQAANQPNITAVSLDLDIQQVNPGLGGSSTQADEITGRTNLHNH